jgi:hypothetical protein
MVEEVKDGDVPEALKTALAEAKAKHGDVFVLHAPECGVTVICERPPRAVYRKFREDQDGPPAKSAHRFENLFLSCLLAPSMKDFDAVLDKMPALADSFGVALWDKTLGAEAASVKKA